MKKVIVVVALCAVSVFAADKKIEKKDLPPAVAAAIDAQAKGADIVGYSKEVEKGKTSYEVETKLSGHTRDLEFDAKGGLLAVEEETTLDQIPAAAKAALERTAGTGKITKVEVITKGKAVSYEAAITSKAGKKLEAVVDAGGKAVKD